MWVCKYIKYLHIFYAVWKSLQHLNFTIRLDVFNEVQLTFERFRLSNRAAGKDERHKVVYFLLPVIIIIKKKSLPNCVEFYWSDPGSRGRSSHNVDREKGSVFWYNFLTHHMTLCTTGGPAKIHYFCLPVNLCWKFLLVAYKTK